MGRRVRAALAALTTLGAWAALPAPVAASTADVMLDQVGSGFELASEETGRVDSLTRTFERGVSELTLTGFPVTDPPGVEALFDVLASPDAGLDIVPEPSLDLAAWVVPAGGEPGDVGFSSLVVASHEHIFSITLLQELDAEIDGPAFVLDVARRQVAAAGGPPGSDDAPRERSVDDADLLPLLPDAPPPAWDLPWMSLTLTGAGALDVEGLSSPEAADFLNDRARNVARVWGTEALVVAVGITQYPYEIFAAAALPGFDDLEPARSLDGRGPGPPDAVAFREPEFAQVGVAFRTGDLLVVVLTSYEAPATEAHATALALDMADWVADRLPVGATAPYEFPSPPSRLAGLGLTALVVTLGVAGSRLIAKLRARRVRRRWVAVDDAPVPSAPPGARPARVVTLDHDAAALRRRGAVVASAQLFSVNVGVVAMAGDFAWRGVGVAAVALVAGLAFSRWWLRHEYTLLGSAAPPRAFIVPRFWGAVTGLAAFVVLGSGVAYLLKGIRYLTFRPTLAQLRWSDLLGVAPRTVGVVFAVGGMIVAMSGAALYRAARSMGRARAQQVLAADPRPPALYLRGFDDDALPLPTIASARRPLFELFSLRGADPFEEAVAWELDSYGPVVAVGRPGRSLSSLGAAREHLPDDTWRDDIAERMSDAGLVVLAPGDTPGLAWELGEIVRGRHLDKTIFVFPPLDPVELARRWEHTATLLRDAGASLGALTESAALVHTVRVADDGVLRLTAAETRDEATYRVAVDRAVELVPGLAASTSTAS